MESSSTKETARIAKEFAARILKSKKTPVIIGLSGNLGSGKTFFTRSFLAGIGVKEKITSPTFVIMREYMLKRGVFKKAYHLDVYRLEPKDLKVLGFSRLLKEKHAIIIIEWAEKIKKLLPKKTIWIHFTHGKKENERIISLSSRA